MCGFNVVEQVLLEKKLWGHVMGIAIPPPMARVVALAVVVVGVAPGINVVAGCAEITQQVAEQDLKKIEDFDAGDARANYLHLQTLEPKIYVTMDYLLTTLAIKTIPIHCHTSFG